MVMLHFEDLRMDKLGGHLLGLYPFCMNLNLKFLFTLHSI